MPQLPLAHVSLGTPGAIWPKQSSYSLFFSDPRSKQSTLKQTLEAFDDDELDAQILEAIDQIIGEVADPKDKNYSENSNPTVYEVVSELGGKQEKQKELVAADVELFILSNRSSQT